MSTPSLKVVVAVTSPVAFEVLNKTSIIQMSFDIARAFMIETSIKTHLAVAVSPNDVHRLSHLSCEILICQPNSPESLVIALKQSQSFDLVAIHDSQRPLTRTAQFHRTIEALLGDVEAARPAAAFTETLKVVTADQIIQRTIDRKSVLKISTPEIIRFQAIDFGGNSSTWFVPLKIGTKTSTVDADPESLRINSQAEITLMESFVHWQQTIATN